MDSTLIDIDAAHLQRKKGAGSGLAVIDRSKSLPAPFSSAPEDLNMSRRN